MYAKNTWYNVNNDHLVNFYLKKFIGKEKEFDMKKKINWYR